VRPRLNGDLLKWGLKFYAHANERHVQRSAPLLKEISSLSKQLFREMDKAKNFEFGYQEKGLLMLFQTAETEREEIEAAHMANQNGVEAHVLSAEEVQRLEPEVKVTARGGVYFPGDAHLIPQLLVSNLVAHLKKNGVIILANHTVEDFVTGASGIEQIFVNDEPWHFDEYVVATGAWSGLFCSKLDIDLPMQSGKGYSFNVKAVKKNIQIPTLLLEGRVAVTPMGNDLRFGGTMEINGTDRSVNMNRVKGIVETIPKYYPEMNVQVPDVKEVWNGLRPCSPDGLPYIGRSTRFKNLVVATGHSMMGISLGPATGKLVTELVDERPTSMDIAAFHPERFN